MGSLQGHLLAASPMLADSSFQRSVVLLLEHYTDGAVGLVLNREARETVGDLWQKISQHPCPSQQRVNLGGPVSGPLMALHMEDALAEATVPPGVCVAANKECLDRLVQLPDATFRLFVGHAGWDAGQLESELGAGAWHITPATPDLIFGDHDDLWAAVLRRVGRSVLEDTLGITEFPPDALLN